MDIFWIAFVVAALFAAWIAATYACSQDSGVKNVLIRAAVAVAAAALIGAYFGADMAILAVGAIVFSFLSYSYGTDNQYIAGAVCLMYVFVSLQTVSPQFIAAAMLVGLLSQMKHSRRKGKAADRRVEVNRDIFHVGIGALLIIAFLFLGLDSWEVLVVMAIVAGYMIAGTAGLSKSGDGATGFLKSLERRGTIVGMGGIWLALGTLIPIVLLNSYALVLPVIVAIFIADPLATIVGLKFIGPAIPYNKSKTVSGTVAYFVVAAIGFYAFGYIGIVLALMAAIAESLPIPFDDNFYIPVFLSIALTAVKVF